MATVALTTHLLPLERHIGVRWSQTLATLSQALSDEQRANLRTILSRLRAPPKEEVRAEALTLAKCKIPWAIGKDFRWEPRGSMFSPYYKHVSDIDLHYFRSEAIIKETVSTLERHRRRLGILSFSQIRNCLGEAEDPRDDVELAWGKYRSDPTAFWGAASGGAPVGLRAVVVTGVVRTCGEWLVPIDITLSSERETSETTANRLAKLRRNIERGKSWKGLQRVRALLGAAKPQRGRSFLRQQIAEDVNNELGHLRFLLIQLELFQRHCALKKLHRAGRRVRLSTYIENEEYFTSKLNLRTDLPFEELHQLCKLELKLRSDAIWLKYKDRLAESLWHDIAST